MQFILVMNCITSKWVEKELLIATGVFPQWSTLWEFPYDSDDYMKNHYAKCDRIEINTFFSQRNEFQFINCIQCTHSIPFIYIILYHKLFFCKLNNAKLWMSDKLIQNIVYYFLASSILLLDIVWNMWIDDNVKGDTHARTGHSRIPKKTYPRLLPPRKSS